MGDGDAFGRKYETEERQDRSEQASEMLRQELPWNLPEKRSERESRGLSSSGADGRELDSPQAESRLMQGSELESFARELSDVRWFDLQLESDYARLKNAYAKLEDRSFHSKVLIEAALEERLGLGDDATVFTDEQWNDERYMREFLKDHPDLMRDYETYLQEKKEVDRLERSVDLGVDRRAQELQGKIDRFTDALGLPRVKLEVVHELDNARGTYHPGKGKVRVLKSEIAQSGTVSPGLIHTVAHELTHLEQDFLIIRKYADTLGIGKTIGAPAQLEALQEMYERSFSKSLSEEFIERVIQARQGKVLTSDERSRAEALEQSIKQKYANTSRLAELDYQLDKLQSKFKLLQPKAPLAIIMKEIADPEAASRLLGTKSLPADMRQLVDQWQAANNRPELMARFDEARAKQTIHMHLRKRYQALYDEKADLYHGDLHEREAHKVGRQTDFFLKPPRQASQTLRFLDELFGARETEETGQSKPRDPAIDKLARELSDRHFMTRVMEQMAEPAFMAEIAGKSAAEKGRLLTERLKSVLGHELGLKPAQELPGSLSKLQVVVGDFDYPSLAVRAQPKNNPLERRSAPEGFDIRIPESMLSTRDSQAGGLAVVYRELFRVGMLDFYNLSGDPAVRRDGTVTELSADESIRYEAKVIARRRLQQQQSADLATATSDPVERSFEMKEAERGQENSRRVQQRTEKSSPRQQLQGNSTSLETETSEFFDSQERLPIEDRAVRTRTIEGAGGVAFTVDGNRVPELLRSLEKNLSDEQFQKAMEDRINQERDQAQRERLRRELEDYRRLGPAERAQVREIIVTELKARVTEPGGPRRGPLLGKAFGGAGTVIALGMLADVILSSAVSEQHLAMTPQSPVQPTFRH